MCVRVCASVCECARECVYTDVCLHNALRGHHLPQQIGTNTEYLACTYLNAARDRYCYYCYYHYCYCYCYYY